MVFIANNSDLLYAHGDDFSLDISIGDYTDNIQKIRLQIAKNGVDDIIIDTNTTITNGNASFILSDVQKQKLELANYVYRISLIDSDGKIDTEKSGILKVKWGV